MIFKSYTITPKGRRKYGEYLSGGNVARLVNTTIYNGNNSTADISTGSTGTTNTGLTTNWNLSISKNSATFSKDSLPITDNISLVGFKDGQAAQTFIGDISKSAATINYGITGIPSGMSVSVFDNGTTGTTLQITYGTGMTELNGTLSIPSSIYLQNDVMGGDINDWNTLSGAAKSTTYQYSYSLTQKGNDGASGEAITMRYMNVSCSCIVYNPSNSKITPSKITVTTYTKTGNNAPSGDTNNSIFIHYENANGNKSGTIRLKNAGSSAVTYTIPATAFTSSFNYTKLILEEQHGTGGTKLDIKDIALMRDGTNGSSGSAGRTGAAVRGPVKWEASERRWCNGQPNNSYPDDEKWIDIITYSGQTYKCQTSYNGSLLDTWDAVKTNWASANTFNFVATDLLLANNAKINFLTNNELYLMNGNNEITGGAKGSDSANTINFWAGSENPNNGVFKVQNDGSMIATKGTFGNLTIGLNSHDDTELTGRTTLEDQNYNEIKLSSDYVHLGGGYNDTELEFVKIMPYPNYDKYDTNGRVWIKTQQSTDTAIYTNGIIETGGLKTDNGYITTCPFNGLTFTFVTTNSNYFTKSNGKWYFNGNDLNLNATDYPNVGYITSASSPLYYHWVVYNDVLGLNNGIDTKILYTGALRNNNTIYFTLV